MAEIDHATGEEIEDFPETKRPKDGWFDQWVTADGEQLKELVANVLANILKHEARTNPRKRKRRPDDQRSFEACTEVLVCNLAYSVLFPSETGKIAVRRDKAKRTTRYDVTAHLKGFVSADHRKGVKMAFNALLFGASKRLPEDIKNKLPADFTMPKVRKALEALHPKLAHFFGTDVGFALMHTESQILIKVLQSLQKAGVLGLGLHDAILVPSSKADMAKETMDRVTWEITGSVIPTELKKEMTHRHI